MLSNSLREQLELKDESILGKWLQSIVNTYPEDTAKFLNIEKDRFTNPVGHILSQETRTIYNELIHDMNLDKLKSSLNEIVKIRSIQEFTPAQAVSFVFQLKKAAREELADDIMNSNSLRGLLEFESRIDQLALLAFDIYTDCREKVYEIRVNEVMGHRESVLRMLARANVMDGSI